MIHLKAKKLTTYWEKLVGLIGADPIYPVYFQTRWGIHTFGVRHPIDVLILDNEHKIVVAKKHLRPNRIFLWNPKWYRVVELPVGSISGTSLSVGEQISY